MLRRRLGPFALSLVLVAACGDSSEGGPGGAGGAPPVEPGPTCTAFCAHAIGTCEAFRYTEASCRDGCQTNLEGEYAKSEACGDAVDAVFQCVTELDCQGVYDWRDRVPTDSYPCEPAVANVGANCPL